MNDIKQLEKRLLGATRRKRLILAAAGLVALVTVGLGLSLLLSAVASVFILPVPVKLVLLAGGIGLVAAALHRYLIAPFRAEKSIIKTALQIEKNHPELKGRLVAALQFRGIDVSRTNFSRALIDLTGRQALELTAPIDFNEIVTAHPLIRRLRSAAVVAVLTVAVGFLLPGMFSKAIDVYSQPTSVVAPPPGFSLMVTPGDAERVKYSDIEIGCTMVGAGFPDEVEIRYRFAEGQWQSEKLAVSSTATLVPNSRDSVHLGLTLKQVRRSFDYYVTAGAVRSESYAVNIVERPRVTNIRLTVASPAYTGLPPMTLDENNGSFAAIVGSRATLDIETNRDISEGYIISDDSGRVALDIDGRRGTAQLAVNTDFSYHIRVRDGKGEENPDPIEYMVTAIPDEYPVITVVYPGFDLNLDESMMLPFKLAISDDFGFSSLVLKYRIVSAGRKGPENVAVVNFPDRIKTEGEVTFNWDLETFNLLPSDYILYFFELADNDRVSGPKVTATRVYAARLPSIDEIVMQTETRQEGRVFEAEKVLEEQRQMARRLKQLSEQMRAAESIDWQKQKELENILERQEAAARQLEEMAEQMDESIEQMENNNLLSEQIAKKLMELQKLFEEVATPEMKEAMKKLAEALKNMDRDELEKAMEDFQISQEEMLERLERSVELLRRMQVEQKMSAMLKMAEEMLLEQNRVNVDMQETISDDDNPRLAYRENQLQKQMGVLKSESEKLESLLADSPFSGSEQHQRFAQAPRENTADEDMKGAEQMLNENRRDEASPAGEAASEKLASMVSEMQEMMMAIADSQGEKLAKDIRRAIDDANYLSRSQEEIYSRCESNIRRGDVIGALAAEQQVLREAVGGLNQRIDELSRQSPFLAAEIRSYLDEARNSMEQACNNLGERRGRSSLAQQQTAMENLNRASIQLLDGLENQKQCNKGGSCNKPGQKMQGMCQNQKRINQETQGTCPNPGEQLSESQRQALKRLAGEQGSVRKTMEELQEEFGNRRDILGRLDALTDEVKQIEEMLSEGQISQDLFDRQLKVYSRMLDVQKSLNRRDYSRERKAVTADDILRASPGPLENNGFQSTETLQDRLNRYLQEGYPRQYEQQIKAYFKALSGMGQEPDDK